MHRSIILENISKCLLFIFKESNSRILGLNLVSADQNIDEIFSGRKYKKYTE